MGDDRYNNFQMQDEQVRDDFSEHSTSMQDRSQFGSLTFVDGQMMQLVLKTKIERNEQKVMVVLKKSGSRLVVQNQVVPKSFLDGCLDKNGVVDLSMVVSLIQ